MFNFAVIFLIYSLDGIQSVSVVFIEKFENGCKCLMAAMLFQFLFMKLNDCQSVVLAIKVLPTVKSNALHKCSEPVK